MEKNSKQSHHNTKVNITKSSNNIDTGSQKSKKVTEGNQPSQALEETKKLYLKYYASPNNLLTSQLRGEHLSIYLNNYSLTDIQILNKILFKYFYFKYIEVSPFDPQKTNSKLNKGKNSLMGNRKYNPLSEGEKVKFLKEQHDKEIETTSINNKIISGIAKHLSLSNLISSFSLSGMKLELEHCKNLSNGINENKSLTGLAINNVEVSLDNYEILLKGLLSHEKIEFLDLSSNNFGDKYGNMISRIIARQTQRRDLVIWSYGLRNEKPLTNEYAQGLISINLHGNKFGYETACCICNALSYDNYIRAIDLSDNNFDNESCKLFIKMMRKNMTLLNLNLRDNQGYDDNIHARLVMKMSKNIRDLYQKYQNRDYTDEEFESLREYIDISFFEIDVPQYIVDFYNNMLLEQQNAEGDNLNNQNDYNNMNDNMNDNNNINADNLQNNLNNNNENKYLQKGDPNNIQEIKDEEEYEEMGDEEMEDKAIIKNSNKKSNTSNNNNENIKDLNEKLKTENLLLKQQIIELKAEALKMNLEMNKSPNDNLNNKINLNDPKQVKENYNKIVNLLGEINELMENVQSNRELEKSKEKENIKNNQENNCSINNNNNINNNEINNNNNNQNNKEVLDKKIRSQENNNITNNNNNITNSNNKVNNNMYFDKANNSTNNNDNKILKSSVKKESLEQSPSNNDNKSQTNNNSNNNKLFDNSNSANKTDKLNLKESKPIDNKQEIKNNQQNEIENIKMLKEKPITESEKKENLFKNSNEEFEPLPYPDNQAEPSESQNAEDRNDNYDEEGNEINLDDLDDEEKLAFLQKQELLRKMQEAAEAQGVHFDPQEFMMMMEEQEAAAEAQGLHFDPQDYMMMMLEQAAGEEEMKNLESGDGKVNKSF